MGRSQPGSLERKRQLGAARGRRDLGWRPPRETAERPGQVGLIRVPGLIRRVERGRAPGQQLDGPFGPFDLPDHPQGQAQYADQPHLTRSLRRFVGRTPSQVATSARGV